MLAMKWLHVVAAGAASGSFVSVKGETYTRQDPTDYDEKWEFD